MPEIKPIQLVHLDNVINFSIAFLMSQLDTESTDIPCPLCDNALVFVSSHIQPRLELLPRISHYRCLCCAATFISTTQLFDLLPNFNKQGGRELHISKPSSMHTFHQQNTS